MLDPKLLVTFREVAVRGSFSAAAEELSFTQPAVSQHIARLERDIGTRLLERDARGVKLTPAGETLLRHAGLLLDSMRRARADVEAAAGLSRPRVRVGAFPTAAASLIPDAARELRGRHPNVELDLHVLEPEEAADRLAAGSLDVGMAIESVVRPVVERIGITHIHVGDDPMLVALPTDHRLASRPAVALEALDGEDWLIPCVGGTCPDSNIVMRACRDAGFEPGIRFESDDYHALLGMAAVGAGVALIPSLVTISSRPDVVVRPVSGRPPTRRILAAVRAGERDPVLERFLDALRISAGRLLAEAELTRAA